MLTHPCSVHWVWETGVEEVELMVMDELEEETGVQPQHVPSQESMPQVPLQLVTYPSPQRRSISRHMLSRTTLMQMV
jgi:hypothetical protein